MFFRTESQLANGEKTAYVDGIRPWLKWLKLKTTITNTNKQFFVAHHTTNINIITVYFHN